MLKLFASLLSILLVFPRAHGANECNIYQNLIDESVKKIMFIGEGVEVPRDENEFFKYCRQAQQISTLLRGYRKCVRRFPQAVLGVALRGAKRTANQICRHREERIEALEFMGCLDSRLKKTQQLGVQALDIADLIGNSYYGDDDLFAYICCSYYFVKKNFKDFVSTECRDFTTKGGKFRSAFVNLAFKDVSEVLCRRLKTLDDCDKKHGRVMENIRLTARRKEYSPDKSIVKSLLAIADRLSPPNGTMWSRQ